METKNSIIQQIHHEASSAEQKILKEAMSIINSSKNGAFEKAEKLRSLGFVNSKTVTNMSKEKIEKAKQLKEHIDTYRIKAPNNKFMTDEAVVELCKKYKLVQAPVHLYNDIIPEKNQNEIINFSIDGEYIDNTSYLKRTHFFSFETNDYVRYDFNALNKEGFKDIESYREFAKDIIEACFSESAFIKIFDSKNDIENAFQDFLKISFNNGFITIDDIKSVFGHNSTLPLSLMKMSASSLAIIYEVCNIFLSKVESKTYDFRIIAPKHMINMDGYVIDDDFKVVEKQNKTKEIPVVWFTGDDPIVQVKVKGGWLNVTAWGDEAELPESFNENLN